MNQFNPERDPLEQLAEEWRERLRRGEHFEAAEYIARHPDLAVGIRDLFPAIVLMEELKPGAAELTGAFTSETSPAEGPPRLERLGDFRILREVGRGGMGVVYEAEQESLGRRVALKILPSQALADRQQYKRFQREARASARLHHSNIVPVYGVGEHEGMCYYVMQFIQGAGLDQVLAELKRLRKARSTAGGRPMTPRPAATAVPTVGTQTPIAGDPAADAARSLMTGTFQAANGRRPKGSGSDPRPSSSDPPTLGRSETTPFGVGETTPRLPGQTGQPSLTDSGKHYYLSIAKIGLQVAEALEYANSQGIIHRDIKPSNLLLDHQGTVWVTDFGLAKALADGENLTHTGDIVGTLRYMAPERFIGHSDARGDIYSLGLTLYELLVQQPAFAETDRNRLIHQVTHQEPAAPRKLNPDIPRDLETIVLKAIDREPGRRYATAGRLAEDLQRFVEDRPIGARRVRTVERLWRWCRRNPALAGLAASVLLLLVVIAIGSSLTAMHFQRLAEQEAEARQQAQDAYEAAERARGSEARLRAQAEDAKKAADTARSNEARQRAMAVAAKVLAETNFQEARNAVEELLIRVSEGRLKHLPGMQPLRKELLESALKYYQSFVDRHGNDPALKKDLADAYTRVAGIMAEVGSRRDALRFYGKAGQLRDAALQRDPKNKRLSLDLAAHYQTVGNLSLRLKDFKAALTSLQRAYDILLSISPQDKNRTTQVPVLANIHLVNVRVHTSSDPEILKAFASVLNDTGAILQPHDPGEALRYYAQALFIYRKLLQEPAFLEKDRRQERGLLEHELARQWSRMGNLIADMHMFYYALAYQQEASNILERLVRDHPKHLRTSEFRRDLASAREAKGDLHAARNEAGIAVGQYRQALAIRETQVAENPAVADFQSELANCLFNLALVEGREKPPLNKPLLAVKTLRRAIEQQRTLLATFPDEKSYVRALARQRVHLARLEKEGGHVVEAVENYRQARTLLESLLPASSARAALGALPLLAAPLSGLNVFARYETEMFSRDFLELAGARAGCGDDRSAIAALKQALAAGSKDADFLLTAPELSGLRDRPEFKAVVKTMKDRVRGLPWLTDFGEAKARAAREKKDLFVYFGGRDWIPPSVAFQRGMLSQDAVVAYLTEHFVPVDLDHPMFGSKPGNYAKTRELITRWRIDNFGAMVLADAQGRAYWHSDRGSSEAASWDSTEEFLKAVAEQRQARIARDRLVARAEKAVDDLEKARLLEAALKGVTIYAAADYAGMQTRIFELDRHNRLGLRAKYLALGLAGQRQRIRKLLERRDWKNALVETNWLIEESGLSGKAVEGAYLERGFAHLALGDFARAAADLARGQAVQSGNPEYALLQVYALVQLGDVPGYRRVCADLLERYQETTNGWHAFLLAWTCSMAPDTLDDWSALTALMNRSIAWTGQPFLNWNALGLVHYRAGNYSEAEKALRRSLVDGPNWRARNELILALIEQRRGKTREARAWLDKFLAVCNKGEFRALHATGHRDVLVYQQLLAEAAVLFDVPVTTVFPGILAHRNRALMHLKQWDKAAAGFSQDIARQPDNAVLYLERARCCEHLKQPGKAAADYAQALTLESQAFTSAQAVFDKSAKTRSDRQALDDACRNFARIQHRLGRSWEAAATLANLAEVWAGDGNRLFQAARDTLAALPNAVGLATEEQGRRRQFVDQSIEILKKAVAAGFLDTARLEQDAYFKPLRERADVRDLRFEMAQRNKFVLAREGILPRNSDAAAPTIAEARGLAARGAWDEAEACYDRAVAQAPADSGLRLERGRFLARRGKWHAAIANYDVALQKNPAETGLWDDRGRCHAMLKQWDQAAADFIRLLDLLPEAPGFRSATSRRCRDIAEWEPAFHKAAALASAANASQLWIGRARYLLVRSEWAKASAAYARALDRSLLLDDPWYEFAAVQALADDREGYRDTCRKMIGLLAKDPGNAASIYLVCRACSLSAESGATSAQFSDWAEKAAVFDPNAAWNTHVRGAALFRAGKYHEAVQRFRFSYASFWSAHYLNALYLALAHHYLGYAAEARDRLKQAVSQLDQRTPTLPGELGNVIEHDWVEANLLRREAEGLLNAPHRRQAGERLQEQQWAKALVQFDMLIGKNPGYWPDRLARAYTHVQMGQWSQAAADYARLVPQRPHNPDLWFEQACLLCRLGDDSGYRKLCSEMRERFGRSKDVYEFALLSHACALAPAALGDAVQVLQLAKERLVRTAPPSDHYPWSVHVLGLAQYRAAQYQAAVETLGKTPDAASLGEQKVLNWLVLAMAEQKRGHATEARAWLDRANQWLGRTAQALPAGQLTPSGWHWRDWLQLQTLRREAEGVVAPK
jgi:serine/threonine protein kinase/Tfp pilus assembly protein PilF